MDTIRHREYFNPINITDDIHVIGVGAVGSHILNNLTRLGIKKIHIWDIDTVSSYNIPNQLFVDESIGKKKTEAMITEMLRINPRIIIQKHNKYTAQKLKGYVFLCVDSILIRQTFYKSNKFNFHLKVVFDTRIALENGQIITTMWNNASLFKRLMDFTDFKEEEVKVETSACGSKLAILPTVQYAATIATSQFINLIKKEEVDQIIYFNAFKNIIKAI